MVEAKATLIPIDEKRYYVEYSLEGLTKKILVDGTRCIGCSLCIRACPFQAISLGPIREILDGSVEAPKIVIDETKCCVCPICSSICLFRAIEFYVNDERKETYPRIEGRIEIDKDKCHLCYICSHVCPTQAIRIDIRIPKKNELVKYLSSEVWARGSIRIHEDRCAYCGLCEALCDAIKIVWIDRKDIKAPDYRYAIAIMVDESKCDYCGLCAELCPYDAIEVECYEHAPRIVEKPRIEGLINVDKNRCIYCGLCAELCPAQAIRVDKPFVGKIVVIDKPDCDPLGCKYCQTVCPVKAFYIPKDRSKGKILVDDRFCIYCGACETVCPVEAIKVLRYDIRLEFGSEPWNIAIAENLHRVLEGFEPCIRMPRISVEIRHREVVEEQREVWSFPSSFNEIRMKLEKVVKELSQPSTFGRILHSVLRRGRES